MNWKKKLTSKTFWISLVGAIVVVLQCFGLKIDAPYVNEAMTAICSVFIILGLMRNDSEVDAESGSAGSENEEFAGVGENGSSDAEFNASGSVVDKESGSEEFAGVGENGGLVEDLENENAGVDDETGLGGGSLRDQGSAAD